MNNYMIQKMEKVRVKRVIIISLMTAFLFIAAVAICTPAQAETGVKVKVGTKTFNGVLYDNPTSKALMKRMPVSYRMSDLNKNEKYKYLSYTLPTNEKAVRRIKAGDIMLYGDDCLVVFYKSFKTSYKYTPVGRITNVRGLKKAAGKGKVTVKISKKTKVALNKKTLTLSPGETFNLKLNGVSKSKVKWKTSSKSVVTVSKGKLKAKKAGSAKVTATYKKKKYVCKITVTKKKPIPQPVVKKAEDIGAGSTQTRPAEVGKDENVMDTSKEKNLSLYIDDTKVSVSWLDNESTAKLKEMARTNPVVINMSRYGGFEQVGSIGTSLPRNDVQMTTSPGDIVLYSGDQMVIFYGSNSWAYTKLGHIENMSTDELAALLSVADRTIKLVME